MKKLFVLIKSDMSLEYQGVQGAHCAIQYVIDNGTQMWSNDTIVFLSCPDLDKWMYKLDVLQISYSKFIEPDIGNIISAIAILGNDKLFKKLKLIGK